MTTLSRIPWLILLLSQPLQAHDFWIEANPFWQSGNEPVEVSLLVGEHLTGKSLPNRLNWYSDFSYSRNSVMTEVPGEMGRNPAGIIKNPVPGTFLLSYHSVTRTARLDESNFRQYLREEGLDSFLNHSVLQSGRKIVEHYTRYAKALVTSSQNKAGAQDDSALQLGYRLELHPRQNPYLLKPGATLDIQLTFDQQPVSDVLVSAFCDSAPANKQQSRTSSTGAVSITLDCSGLWLVKAVTMLESDRKGIDFESFWASLTFTVK